MRRSASVLLATVALLAAGCGDEDDALTVVCEQPAEEVVAALGEAPEAVTLDGEPISTCLDGALTGGEIQRIGAGLTTAADELAAAAPDDPDAALRLGYLVGAVTDGRSVHGIHDDLIRRIEQAAETADLTGPQAAEFRRGLEAGRERG